ncbi:hypothetical protein J2T11_003231 [Paenarthrobacter nicotinovorans]|uniref:HEPN domain-containing protein n=1 Tax=Paenarthrobacter nicotinovorans TaxID=29320 RepID=UPI00278584F4|nr:HEPN domain-containing protein [Paenarthrobacter nicotinovorans]MDP9936863.1 hypothetical protein [Paenarthrobacter nicotinovorans]
MSNEIQSDHEKVDVAGVFWMAGCWEVSGAVEYTEDNGYDLRLSGFCFMPVQVTVLNDTALQFSNDPAHIAADFSPRVILGRLDDGSLVTFMDAHMQPGPEFSIQTSQRFTGKQRLHGAHVSGEEQGITAIRWTWPIPESAISWAAESEVAGPVPGRIGPWSHGGNAGLSFSSQEISSLSTLTQEIQLSSAQLLGLWTQKKPPGPLLTEVFIEDHGWCMYVPRGDEEQGILRRSSFLPLGDLTVEHLATWLPFAAKIDPFPYIANSRSGVIQVDAQVLVTALEGLHRRLHAKTRPFQELSAGAVKRAMDEARAAGVKALADEGFSDDVMANEMLGNVLNHVDQPTYHQRIVQLAAPVCEIAPGICGPDLDLWVKIVKKIRNDQSHQLVSRFGGTEFSSYFVAMISCRWILTLRILLEVTDSNELKAAISKAQNFMFALANMDEEHLWDPPGALDTFREGSKASPSDPLSTAPVGDG